jgi:hypothetical protein
LPKSSDIPPHIDIDIDTNMDIDTDIDINIDIDRYRYRYGYGYAYRYRYRTKCINGGLCLLQLCYGFEVIDHRKRELLCNRK